MTTEDPAVIGRYKVLNRLGAGAMGAVYLCQDPLLKRRVAVKIVLKTRADSAAMMARFQRESEISAQLNHPHIITVYDVGMDEEVGPFLTMEYVDGGSLAGHLEAGPIDPSVALDWLTQLGQALAAAERAGVVHRDIKPDNMLISSDGQLKLTDFGLARDDVSSLTTTGTMMGTPTHTAPELLGGARATPITDRWAFAVTAFQMVTGQLPHSGDTLSAVLHHIDREPPTIPEGTSPQLTRVLLKALHRDPARRYESILAFMTALSDALGLREKLVTKGLGVDPPAAATASHASTPGMPTTSETENFPLPRSAPRPTSSSAIPRPGSGSGPPATPAPNRLTKPPAELFQANLPAAEAAPDEVLVPRISAQREPLPRSSSSGIRVSAPSSEGSGITGNILIGAAIVALAAGFYFWPRPIQIVTVPPGAKVMLNGKAVGVSPYTGTVSYGNHPFVVAKDGYDTVSSVINASDGLAEVKLQPFTDWVDIVSVPSGASVSLGDQALGSTPKKNLAIPDKPQPLVLSLPGYKRWKGTLGPGEKPPVPIVLVREPR